MYCIFILFLLLVSFVAKELHVLTSCVVNSQSDSCFACHTNIDVFSSVGKPETFHGVCVFWVSSKDSWGDRCLWRATRQPMTVSRSSVFRLRLIVICVHFYKVALYLTHNLTSVMKAWCTFYECLSVLLLLEKRRTKRFIDIDRQSHLGFCCAFMTIMGAADPFQTTRELSLNGKIRKLQSTGNTCTSVNKSIMPLPTI